MCLWFSNSCSYGEPWTRRECKRRREKKHVFDEQGKNNGIEYQTNSSSRWWTEGEKTKECLDMGRERLTRGLLLSLAVFFTAVVLCIHVYLSQTQWRGAPAALVLGHPMRLGQDWGQQSRSKPVSAEIRRSVKRRISYVRTLKKNSPARKRNDDREDRSTPCCPSPHSRRKVILHQLLTP